MELLVVAGVFLLAVLIVELIGGRAPTVANTDTWRQAVTGMIQEPAPASFARPAPSIAQVEPRARTSGAVSEPATPVAVSPGLAIPR